MFNYGYNKYLFNNDEVSRSMSTNQNNRERNLNIISNEIKANNLDNYKSNEIKIQYLNKSYDE